MKIRTNAVKERLAVGQISMVAGGITHADDIDLYGQELREIGFDGIWLEGEHGAITAANLGHLTRACDLWGLSSIARVNRNDEALIYRTLDRGAQGIVVPHVNTKSEAAQVVSGGRFPPIGHRGMFTGRQGYGVDNYFQDANNQVFLAVLIEDIKAVENLTQILTVDGIDVFFVAPSDLSASMGRLDGGAHPKTQRIIKDTLGRIKAAGRVAGTMTNNQNVSEMVEAGATFLFVTVGAWLAEGARKYVAAAKSASSQ